MNILLIGNGFDLEHSLPTSYQDFLDFCVNVKKVYTYDENIINESSLENDFVAWKIDDYIKEVLLKVFTSRKNDKTLIDNHENELLDELYSYIKFNSWLEYFLNYSSCKNIGENWIDFEIEIANVVKALDEARFQLSAGGSVEAVDENKRKILMAILKAARGSLKSAYGDVTAIERFSDYLNTELKILIRALEIYIAGFVGKIAVTKKSIDIEKLNPDHILSFNYSDTYERIYGQNKKIEYDYIHGKAAINKNIETCNLVLGIDEYLEDDSKDKEFTFLTFKKFYQRIYKSTGNDYLEWVDEIKDGYADYLKSEADAYSRIVASIKDGSFGQYPYELSDCRELSNAKCPQHTLYIFGHSLDVTDRDVLKLFICNDNVQTKIFYHRKNKDDKKVLGILIKNLIKIMGQDELIRRTGGAHKTIEFIPQTLHEEE